MDVVLQGVLLMEEIQLAAWDVSNPRNTGISATSTGSGFLPSTSSLKNRRTTIYVSCGARAPPPLGLVAAPSSMDDETTQVYVLG